MKYSQIIQEVATRNDLSEALVDKTYKAYWYSIKQFIEQMPLKKEFTLEEYQKLQTSINIPALGKLYCDYWRYYGKNKEFKIKSSLKDASYKESNNIDE